MRHVRVKTLLTFLMLADRRQGPLMFYERVAYCSARHLLYTVFIFCASLCLCRRGVNNVTPKPLEPRRLAVATPLSRTGNRQNDMQVTLELSSEGALP